MLRLYSKGILRGSTRAFSPEPGEGSPRTDREPRLFAIMSNELCFLRKGASNLSKQGEPEPELPVDFTKTGLPKSLEDATNGAKA
jgi:hypothetical protein